MRWLHHDSRARGTEAGRDRGGDRRGIGRRHCRQCRRGARVLRARHGCRDDIGRGVTARRRALASGRPPRTKAVELSEARCGDRSTMALRKPPSHGGRRPVVTKPKVGIIGDGNVGSALRRGLERAGYEVRTVGKEPAQVRETGHWADVIVLAVPYGAIDDAVRELGDTVNGKTIVDVTNALTPDMQLASGCTASGGETLQQKARGAKVVK